MKKIVLPSLFLLLFTSCARESATTSAPIDASEPATAPAGHEEHVTDMAETERAVCVLQPTKDSKVSGVLHFKKDGDHVHITGTLNGLEPGSRGFHIHEYGDLTSEDGKSAGDHFNPMDMPHGAPDATKRHIGDLGNIEANEQGEAKIDKKDPVIKLNGPHSIIGRSVVVHAKADQFTQPSGDAGDRVAVGVIGIAKPE